MTAEISWSIAIDVAEPEFELVTPGSEVWYATDGAMKPCTTFCCIWSESRQFTQVYLTQYLR